jgi:hypothetical protein
MSQESPEQRVTIDGCLFMTPDQWKRIKEVAGDAWAHPAGDREAYVALTCGHDELLRTEVLSLLASMAQAEDLDAFTGRVRRDAADPQTSDPTAADRRRDRFSET